MRYLNNSYNVKRSSGEINHEPESNMITECAGIDVAQTVGFYAWYDKNTNYRLFPKIAVCLFLTDLFALIVWFTTPIRGFFGEDGFVISILAIVLAGLAFYLFRFSVKLTIPN